MTAARCYSPGPFGRSIERCVIANKTDKRRNKRATKREAVGVGRPAAPDDAPLSPPFGYTLAGDGETLAPADDELEVVARIRELSKKRLKIKEIVAKLTEEELTCRGAAWDGRQVSRILRRRVDEVEGHSAKHGGFRRK